MNVIHYFGFFSLKRNGGKISKRLLDVPFGSEAFKELYSGSGCYLKVPEYKK
ncbi:hypothetical protein [Candidatus Uabimicrobium sp. HlEnr_7]|uniref:hypothetical protein n=1 Tax=Candidatus Uabimicrobium helgolandensis TaxID=3095367 RepID=UPI003556C83C